MEIRERAGEYATENMSCGMNCAESVLAALIRSGALDVPPETVAYATGFGSGGGGAGLICGALASAILANNIAHGRKDPAASEDRAELKKNHYKRGNNIVNDFVKESGSGLCREIINQFDGGYHDEATRPNCIRICGAAARIAVDYLCKDDEEVMRLEYNPSVVGINSWL